MSSHSTDGSSPSPPVAQNAPKFGTLVPNRIFVGGISANTTESELHSLFSKYGNVKATKIISDRAGVSKGYGFVTFETEEEARRIQREANNLILKDRRLNIAPAIKKQPFARVFDAVSGSLGSISQQVYYSPTTNNSYMSMMKDMYNGSVYSYEDVAPVVPNGTVLYQNGVPITYHNGMAYFTPPEVYQLAQPQASGGYPVIYQPPIYFPQQHYPYQASVPSQWATAGQWRWAQPSPGLTTQYLYPALSASAPPNGEATAAASSYTSLGQSAEYQDPAIIEASTEGTKMALSNSKRTFATPNRGMMNGPSNGNSTTSPAKGAYLQPTPPRRLSSRSNSVGAGNGNNGDTPRPLKHVSLMPKLVNGVAVMAYPTPMPVPEGALGSGDNPMMTMQPMLEVVQPASSPLTPPTTPVTSSSAEHTITRKMHHLTL